MQLYVDFAESPIVVGTRKPRFSWEVPFSGRGRRQGAYQVLVASSPGLIEEGQPDLWDSGRRASSDSVNIVYDGHELSSNMDCFWTVRLWDEEGTEAAPASTASFGTPLFDATDWQAAWIGMGRPDEPLSDETSFQQDRVAPDVREIGRAHV